MLKKYLEIPIFTAALIALAMMDPQTTGPDLCLLDYMGYPYCPGEGLGHSMAYTFNGEINSAMKANFMGPFAVGMLLLRIIYLTKGLIRDINSNKEENNGKLN